MSKHKQGIPEFDLESWIESAAGGARNPSNWMARAEELKRAFDLLHAKWREEDMAFLRAEFEKVRRGELTGFSPWLGSVAMLLAGLAIENVLKGILIARNPDLVQPRTTDPDRLIDWKRRGHDLVGLADDAQIDLSEGERLLLGVLGEFVSWAGRYPVSLKASDMRPRSEAGSGGASFTVDQLGQVSPLFDSVLEQFREEVQRRHVRDEEAKRARQKVRRDDIESKLAALDSTVEDGIVLFHSDLRKEPGAAVGCAGCGGQFMLDPSMPAAICMCGTLYYGEKKGVAGRMGFSVESIRAQK